MKTYQETYVDDCGFEHRYDVHSHEEAETIECCYCGAIVPGCESCPNAPPADHDGAWEALAELHNAGCEWIRTRAHRRDS
jgi:hypothetical protein